MSRILAETADNEETKQRLLGRRAEREALLGQITESLDGDDRIAAAWLFGSMGRGEFGPQEVDWTWQPLSGACLWPGTRLLLNRAGLTLGEMPWGYQPRPAQTPLEETVQRVSNFWAMLLIIAKYAARTPSEDSMGLVGMAVQPLREVSEYLGLIPRYVMENLPPHRHPQEKVRLLRDLAGQMEALTPAVEARGGHVPWAAVPQAYRFLDLVGAVMGEMD